VSDGLVLVVGLVLLTAAAVIWWDDWRRRPR
jgi:hypothetical protein